ncbi:NUDIX hydrolase [Sphingomonas sp. RS2018]
MADEPVIPAATVVVMRDRDGAPPELLMVERSRAMRFAGGALVFPGGRVDAGDVAMAGGDDELAARIAAIRECIEEAGVAPGLDPAADLAAIRRRLHDSAPMVEALAGAAIDAQALVPFARWLPRGVTHRIFDTRFYLARLPEGAPEPVVDATENTRVFWSSARAVLDAADAGRASIIYPTRRNLDRLALFGDVAAAMAHARAFPVRTVTPWSEMRDGVEYLCIPDDLGYPVTAEPMRSVQRA